MHYALTSATAYWATLRPDEPRPVHLDCDTPLDALAPADEWAEQWLCGNCEVSGGLLKPSLPNQSSQYHRTVLEAASWRLATDLALRHPDLRVYRTFPHLGTSDVLTLLPKGRAATEKRGPLIYLDRVEGGRIQVLERSDDMEVVGGPWTWDEYLTTDGPSVLEQVEYAAGLWTGQEDMRHSTEGLVYDLIARIASLALMGDPLIISNGNVGGFFDTRPKWWEEIALRNPDLTAERPADLDEDPGFRFWRIERNDFALTLETTTATAWGDEYDADEAELMEYDEGEVSLKNLLSPDGNRSALEAALELGEL